MRARIKKIMLILAICLLVVAVLLIVLAQKPVPEKITYGISFNVPYALELGIDPKKAYDAFLKELGVRHLRLAAHWTLTEPKKDTFDFSWLDYQVEELEKVGGDAVFGVGRRLPRWPECHVPSWAKELSWEEQKIELRDYITRVVERYKKSPAIKYWQVENEPYLGVFATEHCSELDESFLEEEIALVRSLDPTRQILVTDSGNLGTWRGAYSHGDLFGTSVYVYFWNPSLGQFKTVLPPAFYRMKENVMEIVYGKKDTLLIELALEPWLLESVVDVPIETQYTRMDSEKFDQIIAYAKKTRYDRQYLWGGEWWYWLREQGHPEMWEKGRKLFE